MSNFWARTITGLSMVFILLAAIWFSGLVFASIFLLITILGLWEFYGLLENETCRPQKFTGTVTGAGLYVLTSIALYFPEISLPGTDSRVIPVLFMLLASTSVFVAEIYRNRPNPLINVAITLTGILYIAVPFSLLLFFNRSPILFLGMPVVLVAYFAFTWINDTGAYLYGRQFGRNKFFERISPKKTWEGTIAGAVITWLLALGFHAFVPGMALYDWISIATLVIIFGTHGDLVESLFKRSLNIKDSGTILPGHGGILDRFDTMLVSAPFVFLYLFFRNLI